MSIVSHSHVAGILECLAALNADSAARRSSVTITVLDNASRDGSARTIRRHHPDVRVIEGTKRQGFGHNHNTVIQTTSSRYVLVLNDDVRVTAGMIDALVSFLDDHPAAAAAGPRVTSADGDPTESAWRLPSFPVLLLFALSLGRYRAVQSTGAAARRVEQISACALMLRRAALDTVGAFDESFFMYAEDTDLCKRLAVEGLETWYVPAAEVVHLGGRSTAMARARRISEEWRSRERYWVKHHGPRAARVALWMRGAPYAVGLCVVKASRFAPAPLRRVLKRWPADDLTLQVRSASGRSNAPGLSDLAHDWNADADTARSRRS